MFAIITVYPLLSQKPHIPPLVLLDMVYFLVIQTVLQTYILINLPFTYSTTYEKKHKKQTSSHFYKTIHVFHKYSKMPCKNMKKLIKIQDINVFIFQSVIIINFSYPQFLVCGRIYHKWKWGESIFPPINLHLSIYYPNIAEMKKHTMNPVDEKITIKKLKAGDNVQKQTVFKD